MKIRTKRILAGAGAAALMAAGAAIATPTAQAVETRAASCASSAEDSWFIPSGHVLPFPDAGLVYWHDYNEDSGNDQDNFEIADHPADGMSSSLWVRNNYTGKTYYKHVYSGSSYCMGVGNIPNGESASWRACGWDEGVEEACLTGTKYE